MARTTSERQDEIYKIILRDAEAVYSLWKQKRIRSKHLVAQAKKYAFDKRLKRNISYRFRVLVFAYALSLRVERRYASFFRKLFLFFAFIKERDALRLLKRVFGFDEFTEIREILAAEVEKIDVLFTKYHDRRTAGGRRFAGVDDLSIEESFEHFVKEYIQKDTLHTAKTDAEMDSVEFLEDGDRFVSADLNEEKRGQISVDEITFPEKAGVPKGARSPLEETEEWKEFDFTKETETLFEVKKEEKTTAQPLEDLSAAEGTPSVLEKAEKETPSPFPVFREPINANGGLDNKNAPMAKEEKETPAPAKEGNAEKNISAESQENKSPFPVFRGEKVNVSVAAEKPIAPAPEKRVGQDFKGSESFQDFQIQERKSFIDSVSEENKARINVNTTMSDAEIQAIVTQLKDAAKMTMKQEEEAWREKISVSDHSNNVQTGPKIAAPPQNSKNAMPASHK